jgi:hypothetical protein
MRLSTLCAMIQRVRCLDGHIGCDGLTDIFLVHDKLRMRLAKWRAYAGKGLMHKNGGAET